MRSRERLAEVLRSANAPVLAAESNLSPEEMAAILGNLARAVETKTVNAVIVRDIGVVRTGSPHLNELLDQAAEYLEEVRLG